MKALLRYIQGFRKGKEAHRLELDSMKDPFLAESLEGYDAVKGNHAETIHEIQRRISTRTRSGYKLAAIWSIAASLLLCIGLGGYYWLKQPEHKAMDMIAYEEIKQSAQIPDSVMPEIKQEVLGVVNDMERVDEKHTEKQKTTGKKARPIVNEPVAEEEAAAESVVAAIADNSVADISDTVSFAASASALDVKIRSPYDLRVVNQPKEIKDSLTNIKRIKQVGVDPDANYQQCVVREKQLSVINIDKLDSSVEESDTLSFTLGKQPVPLIGMDAYRKYIEKNIVYPQDSVCGGIKGVVIVEFTTDKSGTPVHLMLKKRLCGSADQEAIRLIKYGPKWTVSNVKTRIRVNF